MLNQVLVGGVVVDVSDLMEGGNNTALRTVQLETIHAEGDREFRSFHTIKFWNVFARNLDICVDEFVLVCGERRISSYKKDGKTRKSAEIHAQKIDRLYESNYINSVSLTGKVVGETRYREGDKAFFSFTVLTWGRGYKQYHECVAYGESADYLASNVERGHMVQVSNGRSVKYKSNGAYWPKVTVEHNQVSYLGVKPDNQNYVAIDDASETEDAVDVPA